MQPMYNEREVRSYIEMFKQNPGQFNREQGEALEKYATFYQIPHKKEDFDYSFSILDGVKQLGQGFLEGFTTLKVGKPSLNPYENVLRSIGQLVGFVGYIPAPAVAGATKVIGLGARAAKIAKFMPMLSKLEKTEDVYKALRGISSVPMMASNFVTGKTAKFAKKTFGEVAKAGKAGALGSVTKFLTSKPAQSLMESSFHLGVASSVSNWQHGVDQMVKSFAHGAATGAVFGAFGEVFQKGMVGVGLPIELENLAHGKPIWSKITNAQKADVGLRMVSSSLFTGLPATLRDATAPEQVYEYLLGAYFGYSGNNSKTAEAQKFMNKYSREKDKNVPEDFNFDPAVNTTLKPLYEALAPGARKLVDNDVKAYYAPRHMNAYANELYRSFKGDERLPGEVVRIRTQMDQQLKEAEAIESMKTPKPVDPNVPQRTSLEKMQVKIDQISRDAYTRLLETTNNWTINQNSPDANYSVAFNHKTDPVTTFFDKSMLPKEQKFDPTNMEHLDSVKDIRAKWNELQPQGKNVNGVDDFIKYLSDNYNFTANEQTTSFWRNQSNSRRYEGRKVLLEWNAHTKTMNILRTDKDSAGNINTLIRTELPEETYYKEAYLKLNGEAPTGESVRILKHGINVVKDKNDKPTDKLVTINNLSNLFLGQQEMAGIIDSQLKDGFYPFSGVNDKEQIVFAKWHPEVDKMSDKTIHDIVTKEVAKYAEKGIYKKTAGWTKDGLTWGNQGLTSKARDKAIVSNAFYIMAENGLTPRRGNIKKIMTSKGFISDAVDFNKRVSIPHSNGIPVDSVILNNELGKDSKAMLRAIIVDDPSLEGGNTKNANERADAFNEKWDGKDIFLGNVLRAINNTVGTPTDGNMAKLFMTIRDTKNEGFGALFNKSGTRAATRLETEFMGRVNPDGTGVEAILHSSTAKQTGGRKVGTVKVDDKGWGISGEYDVFEFRPEDIKVITGKKYDAHLLDNKRLAKQITGNMITHLMKGKKGFMSAEELVSANKIADEIYNDLILTNKAGDPEYNNKLIEYIASDKKDPRVLDDLLKNHDKIGIDHITETLSNPNAGEFEKRFYDMITGMNPQDDLNLAIEDGLTPAAINEIMSKGAADKTAIERHLNNGGSYNHKFANSSKLNPALASYIIKRITRPVIGNSLEAVIDTYDPEMRFRYPDLMKNDNLFLLGKKHGNKRLKSTVLAKALGKKGNYVTLREAFDNQDKFNAEQKVAYGDLVEILASRMPIDSPSGSQMLKFYGFTNRDDYGILLHPRTMQFLGGADSDSDTAHIYFGGDGGFKKKWKDLIHTQKYEHGRMVNQDGSKESYMEISTEERGSQYSSQLIIPSKGANDPTQWMKAKGAHLDPFMRLRASKDSYETRKLLSSAVTNKAIIGATHAEWIASGRKDFIFDTGKDGMIVDANRDVYQVKVRQIAKNTETDITEFRGLATEAIKLAVDPSKQGKMIGSHKLFKKTLETLFKHDFVLTDPLGNIVEVPDRMRGNFESVVNELRGTDKLYRNGATKYLNDVNRALFGKDVANNRPWTEGERKGFLNDAKTFVGKNPVTFLGRYSKALDGISWSTDYLTHLSKNSYQAMFDTFYSELHGGKLPAMGSLKKTPMAPNKIAMLLMDMDLNNPVTRQKLLEFPNSEEAKLFFNNKGYMDTAKKASSRIKLVKNHDEYSKLASGQRAYELEKVIKFGNDMVSNDINFIAQTMNINDMVTKFDIPKEKVKELLWFTKEKIKGMYNTLRADGDGGRITFGGDQSGVTYSVQEYLNDSLVKYKSTLTGQESALLDQLLLSPFGTGDKYTHGRLPLDLPAVSNESVKLMNGRMDNLFNEMRSLERFGTKVLNPKEVEKSLEYIVSKNPNVNTKENGTSFNGMVLIADGRGEHINVEGGQHLGELKFLMNSEKGILPDHVQKVANETKFLINDIPTLNLQTLPGLFKGLMRGKDMMYASLNEWKAFNTALKDIANGAPTPMLEKLYTYMFPEKAGKMMMKHSMTFNTDVVPYIDKNGEVQSKGYALEPVESIQFLQGIFASNSKNSESLRTKLTKDVISNDTLPYESALGAELSHELWKAATGKRELGVISNRLMTNEQKIEYLNNSKKSDKIISEHGNKKFNVTFGSDKMITMSGSEIVDKFMGIQDKWSKINYSLKTGKPGAIDRYAVREFLVKGKDRINTKGLWFSNSQQNYDILLKHGYKPAGNPLLHDVTGEVIYDHRKYVTEAMAQNARQVELPHLDIGLDGRRKILNSMLKTVFNDGEHAEKMMALNKITIPSTKFLPSHVPHKFEDQILVGEIMRKTIDKIDKNDNLSATEKRQRIDGMIDKFNLNPNKIDVKSFDANLLDIIGVPNNEKLSPYARGWLENNNSLGSMKGRTSHMPGWDLTPQAWITDFSDIARKTYALDSQIASHFKVYDFYAKNKTRMGDAHATQHFNFYKLYIQGALGHSVSVPQHMKDDPEYNIKGTLIDRLSNDSVAKTFTKVGRKLGLLKTPKTVTDDTGVTLELRNRLEKYEFTESDMMWVSNMEAKYELASLLSHPKTYVTNIYGGEGNTLVNAGFNNLLDSRSMKYLQTINPDWKSEADIQNFINGLGVREEFIIHQIGLNPNLSEGRFQKFTTDVLSKLKGDPGMSDRKLLDIAKKYQIGESVLEKAAWFMRKSERILRRDAFMSHYVQSYKNWGSRLPYDHPYLIKQGLEGVKATQFLYCVTPDTEILTKNGFKKHSEVRAGDDIYSINKSGALIEDKINKVNVFNNHYGIKVTKFSHSDGFEMEVTDDHRNVVQNYNSRDKKWQDIIIRKTKDFKSGHNIVRVPLSTTREVEKIYSDEFVKLLAWIVSEGHYIKFNGCSDRRNIRITQSHTHNPDYVAEIRDILCSLGEYAEFKNKNTVFTLRKELADKVHIAIPNKILTYDLVNKFTNEQMLLFVDTFGKGDGHKRKTGEWTISQKHKDTLDIMQYMLTINGVKSSITFNGVNHLNILKSKRTAVVNLDKEVKSVRTVWCPTTNTGMWIARKNGRVFITGNSAPFKPMFANTAFGKIATRFQLWAWNNVRLKNNIINDAHKYGFREGTEAYSRFQRMATMDLLAVGLANAFMYSIFESALPAPWNWVQDMGDWVFGDEKEKEKAFFGAYPTEVAPLQMITPPALRMMPPMIKALIRNDASVISDYHIWTMFPFGRIGRDIFGKGNVMENPYQIIEKTTGIPYREISRSMVETRGTKPFVGGY